MSVYPNVVIAGAPKCGTSSLFSYLEDHPEVCGSSVKETRYLLDSDYPLYNYSSNIASGGVALYQKFFSSYQDGVHRIVVEASPDYLYQKTALRILSNLESTPNIMFVLRKPSSRVYSFFRYAQNNIGTIDRKMSLSECVDAIDNGSLEKSAPLVCRSIDQSFYYKYLVNWYDAIGRDRIYCCCFEDLADDVLGFMRDISDYLEIDDKFYDDYPFGRERSTIQVRSQNVRRMRRRADAYARRQPSLLARATRKVSAYIDNRWNRSPNRKQMSDEDAETLRRLDERYRDDIFRLEGLTGLDLSAWHA